MRNFERGSVTVFLTLILIPTIIITAVLMDMSRIRLFSNQAIMAADNYAEGVLAEYDNLLKELYGVFAVTQDKEGVEAINDLREYVKTSFDPSGKIMNFGHLAGILSKDIDGFMPYKPKEAEEGIVVGKDEFPYYEAVEGANLSNPYVLGTQIGDFMRYRMFKELGKSEEEGGGVLDTLDSLKSIEADSEVSKKMENVMKKISAIIEKQEKFYDKVLDIEIEYYNYLKMLNKIYDVARYGGDIFSDLGFYLYVRDLNESSCVFMEDYPFDRDEPTGMRALINGEYSRYFKKRKLAVEASDNMNLADNEYEDEKMKRRIEKELRWYADSYQSAYNGADSSKFKVRIDNYAAIADELKIAAENLVSSLGDLMETIKGVESGLNDENISENMRENVKSTLELYKHISDYSDGYVKIAEHFIGQKSKNEEFKHAAELINNYLRVSVNYYLNEHPNLPENIKSSREDDFWQNKYNREDVKSISIEKFDEYKDTYNSRYDAGDESSDVLLYRVLENANSANYISFSIDIESIKKELEEVKNIFKEKDDNNTDIKKVPNSFEIEDTGSISQSGSISDFFKKGTLDTRINKIYTISYALGMFSNRVDRYKGSKTSMTGYDMSRLNYMYGGELEYLLRGSREPKENLNDTRNKILTFRSGVNLASTFTISKINNFINEYTLLELKDNPMDAIAYNVEFRLTMADVETVVDWKLLRKSKKVALMKNKLDDLSAKKETTYLLETFGIRNDYVTRLRGEVIGELEYSIKQKTGLNEGSNLSEGEGNDSRSIKLDYSQFVNIMLMIFVDTDTLVKRTGNLICINVNNAINNGNLDSQRFTLKNAVTAVKGTSSVHFKFFMLPNGFGGRNNYEGMGAFSRKVVDQDTYNKMKEIEKNRYMFSVIRGY